MTATEAQVLAEKRAVHIALDAIAEAVNNGRGRKRIYTDYAYTDAVVAHLKALGYRTKTNTGWAVEPGKDEVMIYWGAFDYDA